MSHLHLSGERFVATYRIEAALDVARVCAQEIGVEQSVEFPPDLIADEDIRRDIIGRIESFVSVDDSTHEARISFAVELAGGELTQLLNVLFGNTSLKANIGLVDFELPNTLGAVFRGPRFGLAGLRRQLGIEKRPLLATAIKPMGLAPETLANLAEQFARGGIDIVKDDHGLANQPFGRFEERVTAVAQAVERANRQAGTACVYAPNVTAAPDVALARALFAKRAGAQALLFAPGLAGWDTLRMLADNDDLALPILCHPALLVSRGAFSHRVLYGQLPRLAGADATIFPSFGGRFAFTRAECADLCRGAGRDLSHLRAIAPFPAGGITLERVTEQVEFYGADVGLLMGGDLFRHGPQLEATCRKFRALVEQLASS